MRLNLALALALFVASPALTQTVYPSPSSGGGITQLTGDVTAGPGSGSQATTLATVNSNVGSFTGANITVNAKGLITAASNGSGGGVPANLTLTNPASAATFTLLGGKTFVVDNGLTLAGTDSTTMTFPSTSQTIPGLGTSNTWSASQTYNSGASYVAIQFGGVTFANTSFSASASTGCGSGAGISGNTNAAFVVTLGTSPSTTCVVTFGANASHGWACHAEDIDHNSTITAGISAMSATGATGITVAFYSRTTGLAASPTAADRVTFSCPAF